MKTRNVPYVELDRNPADRPLRPVPHTRTQRAVTCKVDSILRDGVLSVEDFLRQSVCLRCVLQVLVEPSDQRILRKRSSPAENRPSLGLG